MISREQIDLQNPQNSNLNPKATQKQTLNKEKTTTISREQIDLQNLQKKNMKI
jgi:hypothetical protein